MLSYGVEFNEAYVFKDEGFCPYRARRLYYAETQGVAALALGYVLHWAFSPPLLNPKLSKRVVDEGVKYVSRKHFAPMRMISG